MPMDQTPGTPQQQAQTRDDLGAGIRGPVQDRHALIGRIIHCKVEIRSRACHDAAQKMPPSSSQPEPPAAHVGLKDASQLPRDAEFDQAYPPAVREASAHHWTSVAACHQAAQWLVTTPHTRVLDIGSGPGKFCAIGAWSTPGHFTGVEQRKHLCRTAQMMLDHYGIERVHILHANVTDLAFDSFDAFYLFNPFEENLQVPQHIDDAIPVYSELYEGYVRHVRNELDRAPLATRVVTYWGHCDEIPACYDCEKTAFGGELKLWVKRRHTSEITDIEAGTKS